LEHLKKTTRHFRHLDLDIRDRQKILDLFKQERFDVIIHCAAQPSHDKAAEIPFVDFDVNAVGTLNLLEATRQSNREAVFIFMSTNKVYGDAPNEIPLKELPTRWDYARPEDWDGVSENCRIDCTLHSLFGASKAAADVVAQEYGRYFQMNVGIFRGGCLTGEHHSGAQAHGFLSYLIKVAKAGQTYSVFGYKGKQVRDQIHSADVISAFVEFAKNRGPAKCTISVADAKMPRRCSNACRKSKRCWVAQSRPVIWIRRARATTSATSAICENSKATTPTGASLSRSTGFWTEWCPLDFSNRLKPENGRTAGTAKGKRRWAGNSLVTARTKTSSHNVPSESDRGKVSVVRGLPARS
jgi:nucleoside-diphosphate-sugar epimerase